MNYIALGATIFVAVLLVAIIEEAYTMVLTYIARRKRRAAMEEWSNKLIAQYANVDSADDVVKEWTGE